MVASLYMFFFLSWYGSGWSELCAVMYNSMHLGFGAFVVEWLCSNMPLEAPRVFAGVKNELSNCG